jgi:hypothetical protein
MSQYRRIHFVSILVKRRTDSRTFRNGQGENIRAVVQSYLPHLLQGRVYL